MTANERANLLNLLDHERQTVLYPGVTRYTEPGIVRDVSDDGESGEIAYSNNFEEAIDRVIAEQIQLARDARYELEWKVFGHDYPPSLGERLSAAGFEAGDQEAFLVFRATEETLAQFGTATADIRPVTDDDGLRDYQAIREEVRGENCQREIDRYRVQLQTHPRSMTIYVAYFDGEPATCGRIYFHEQSRFAGLYGGQTREKFRKRGLFTQVVAARLREAVCRGIEFVSVDALPTSGPILRKRGFEYVTYTQPYCWAEKS